METINERIKMIVEVFANGKNTKMARALDTSEANIRNYTSSVMPKFDILNKIVTSFDISPEWLLTGKGPMRREEDIKSPQRRILVGQGVNGDIHNNGMGDVNVSGVVTSTSKMEKTSTPKETCDIHETKIELLTKENQAQAMMIEELKSQIRSKDSTIEWLKQKCDEEAAHNRSLVNELLGKNKA
jgi:transcriptional regulator